MSKFVHNKSTAQVSLINGKILVPVGGKVPVTDQEAEHEDTIHAVRAGWIKVEGEVSSTKAPAAPTGIEFSVDPMKGSATIPVVEKKEVATSSLLGETPEVKMEAESKPNKSSKAKKSSAE